MVRSYTAKLSTEQENSLKVLDAMGRTLDRKINIVDSIDTEGGKANAYFEPKTNEYTIALDSVGEAYLLVAAHENVHDIAANNREGYAKMESIVMDTLESLGLDEETLMDVQRALAPNENEAYWREEIVANTVPSILSGEATLKEFVQKMAGADADTRSAFVKFLDTMRDFLRNAFDKLKVELSWQQMQIISENQQAIERIRGAYFEALDGLKGNTRSENGSNEVYSIRYTTDNVPFVLADRDILDGVPKSQWVKTVKRNLKERFPNGVLVGKNTIYINKASRSEMTFSKYMQWAFKNDRTAYSDKLRATDNADEIIRAAQNFVSEALLHPRKDEIRQFARGNVLLHVGENDYTANVIVGTNKNGKMLLYDVINLTPTSISERNKKQAQPSDRRKSEVRRNAVPIETVAQSETDVNPESQPRFSMQDNVEETDKLLAIHNLTGSQMNGVLELGGFPMPSIAVLKATQGHDRYGDVSVVFDKATIDPKASTRKYLFLRSSNPPLHPPALSPAAPP